jgi:hypothetical protein
MVHVELDASARTSDTVFMSVVNRDRKWERERAWERKPQEGAAPIWEGHDSITYPWGFKCYWHAKKYIFLLFC